MAWRFRPKVMAGIDFSIMKVKIDFLFIYYTNAGAAVDATAGVVF